MVFCAACAAAGGGFSNAQEPEEPPERPWEKLILKSGDELSGRSLETYAGQLVWMYRDGEILQVPLDQIERLEALPPPPELAPDVKLTDPEAVINGETPPVLPFEPLVHKLEQGYTRAAGAAVVWTRRLQLGGQFNNGNADTSLIDVAGVLERNTKTQMRQIDINGQWGENKGKQTVNRWYVNSNFDWPVHDKWIAFVTSKNEYNEPANLDYRGTLSAGGGYRFFNDDKRRMIVRFGPAYTLEVYISPSNIRHTPDMFGELEMKWPVFQRTVLEQKMRVQPSLLNAELVRVFSTTGLMVDLDEKNQWKLRFGLNYQYNSQPNPGRVPSDYTTTVSLVYQRK